MTRNVGAIETLKARGIDLIRDHRDELPPQYLCWPEEGYRQTAADINRDQEIRTEVFDAVQDVLAEHDLLITPTLSCLAVENADEHNTVGPTSVNGVEVHELIGWCLTYPLNFTGHPAASVPAGLAGGNLPVGTQIIGRRYADSTVLTASAVLERLQPWRDSYQIPAQRRLS